MNIEKRGKSYRIRPKYKGKRYTITFDHKPTQREIADAIAELKGTDYISDHTTLGQGYEIMIKDKSNVLSPSTIRRYETMFVNLSDSIKVIKVSELTNQDIQREVNRLSGSLAPKTVHNYYGLISSIVTYVCPGKQFNVKLPTKTKQEPYCPSENDIRALLDYTQTNEYAHKYLFPILCGCHGMRLGEVTALTDEDVDPEHRTIRINKSKVQNKDNAWEIKPSAKTSKSNRIIVVSADTIEAYTSYGLYEGYPKTISDYMRRVQDKLNIPHFSFHKLRHYFASTALEALPQKTVQDYGGWSSGYTLNRIYEHNLQQFNSVAEVISKKTV